LILNLLNFHQNFNNTNIVLILVAQNLSNEMHNCS